MEHAGKLLRDARETLGLTLQEAERATRIRARYLQALEAGAFDEIPSEPQTRGFLRNYADYLGLDPQHVLEQYQGGASPPSGSGNAAVVNDQLQARPRTGLRRWLTPDLLVAGGLSIALVVALIWGGAQLAQALGEEAEPTATAASAQVAARVTASPTFEQAAGPPATVAPTIEGTLPPELTGPEVIGEGIQLRLLIEQRAWLQVEVDGEVVFAARAAPGDILEFQGQELLRVTTGNGRGVRVVHNGTDQGHLGDVGEVVVRLWTTEGSITPTPTATETAAPSETPTPTAPAEAAGA